MRVFKIQARGQKRSTAWYGKLHLAPGRWSRRIRLFTDKAASERQLAKLQTEHDQRAAGIRTAETDRLSLPLTELLEIYIRSLRQQGCDAQHVRITNWMTGRLFNLGGWKSFTDISVPGVEKVLATLAAEGKTASYRNKYIVRIKAFVHHFLPDGWPDPLKKLRRVREKGSVRRRERRAASPAEARAFFASWSKLPLDRHLSYALATVNGFRRNEIRRSDARKLRWKQLHLNATIPFVTLAQKNGDGEDHVPLHPYVVQLLRKAGAMKMPEAGVVGAVPDVATLEADLLAVGVVMTDAAGRRLDFHALRHTFQTNLDRTGCSRATKKKLMRQANADVTDGYAHAELAEMLAALTKLPSPTNPPMDDGAQLKTGTDDRAISRASKPAGVLDHQLDHGMFILGHLLSPTGTDGAPANGPEVDVCNHTQPGYTPAVSTAGCMIQYVNIQQLQMQLISWPSTQVD